MKLFSEYLLEKQEKEDFTDIHNDDPENDLISQGHKIKSNKKEYIIEAHKLEEHMKHAEGFNDEHLKVIRHYKTASEDFNSKLRKTRKNEEEDDWMPVTKESFKHLDQVTSHKLEHNYTAFRGFNNIKVSTEILNKKPGEIIHDKGYTGTTLRRDMMRNGYGTYIEHPETKQNGFHYAKIYIPKGTKGFFMDSPLQSWGIPHENELTLHRGTKFQVLGHTTTPVKDIGGYSLHHVTHLKVVGNSKK